MDSKVEKELLGIFVSSTGEKYAQSIDLREKWGVGYFEIIDGYRGGTLKYSTEIII